MLSRTLMAVTLWLVGVGSILAREKTDIVYFTNGDRIHCEIKNLQRGKLTVKSIGFGTIAIEWDKIAHIESAHPYQLELHSGTRYLGAIEPGAEDGKLEIATLAGTTRLDLSRIVSIYAVEATFWQRLDGSVDIGYDFTQASTATGWSLGAEAKYLTKHAETHTSLDSLYRTQDGADPVNRQNISVTHVRYIGERWFGTGLGQGERNANQALEFRGLLGVGIGRRVLHTNRTAISLLGAAAFSKENYTDTDFLTKAEAIAGFLFDTYRFNSPEVQFTVSAFLYPNLDFSGRYRFRSDGNVRLELFKDLFWQLSYFESFDSDPPSASTLAIRNDFGLATSFGWSF